MNVLLSEEEVDSTPASASWRAWGGLVRSRGFSSKSSPGRARSTLARPSLSRARPPTRGRALDEILGPIEEEPPER